MKDPKDFTAEDVINGQLLYIDKPLEWTSFDVVKKLRYNLRKKFGFKKLKVGHAGTLDPLATGLLLICTGKFTKKIQELTGQAKTYTGTFTLGATTPSFDLETEPENQKDYSAISKEDIEKTAAAMTGEQLQTPPVFSAKWVDGKRAYESARKGIEVEMKKQAIEIHEFKITSINVPEVEFEITCSKGTYIRSIAHDFGQSLSVGAYLSSLRRTAIGDHRVENAIGPIEFVDQLEIPD